MQLQIIQINVRIATDISTHRIHQKYVGSSPILLLQIKTIFLYKVRKINSIFWSEQLETFSEPEHPK